jgi:hypothetical protein
MHVSGIPASKRDFHWHWSSPLGLHIPFPSFICCDVKVLQAAKDVNTSRETLTDLFSRIERFFVRLETYIDVPPTMAMKRIIIEIMAEVLSILGIATKEIKRPLAGEFILERYVILHSLPFSEILQEACLEE